MTRPMSEEREKLEPCPFCGRQPEFNKLFAWCWGPPSAPHQLVSQYHETWRTRSTSSAERGMREALRAAKTYLMDVSKDRSDAARGTLEIIEDALSGIEPGEDEQARGQGRSAP